MHTDTSRRRGQRPGTAVLVTLAMLAPLALVTACGSDQSASPALEPGPSVGSDERPIATVVEAVAGPTSAPPRPVGPPLAAGSSAEEILAAVSDAHGPTDDATGQINRFGSFPALATPPEAELVELRADARPTGDGGHLIVTSQVVLDVSGDQEQLVAFYRRELNDLGWPTVAERRPLGPAPSQVLVVDDPDGANPLPDLTVTIGPVPDGRTRVRVDRVEWVTAATDTTVFDRFAAWADGLPLPEGGQVIGAGIQTSAENRHSLHLTLTVAYDDLTPADAAAALRRNLPAGGFSERPTPPSGDALDNWVFLDNERFAEARVSPHPGPSGGTHLAVTARMALTPP